MDYGAATRDFTYALSLRKEPDPYTLGEPDSKPGKLSVRTLPLD